MENNSLFNRLDRHFFERATLDVARDILGKYLIKDGLVGQITEVEAYLDKIDPAAHSFKGIKPRCEVMFGPAGFSYVYFIYGMYHCFNIVTEKVGCGSAILVRGVKPVKGFENHKNIEKLANGPGKLCKVFRIDRSHNGLDLCQSEVFFIGDDGFRPKKIKTSKRIGITKGVDQDWRFFL